MSRKGTFKTHKPTENQCSREGEPLYTYEIKLVFLGAIKLDEEGFIVRHERIDSLVQSTLLFGSCEEMHRILFDAINEAFKHNRIQIKAYKATISPDLGHREELLASLDYIWTDKFVYLPLLS